MSVGTASVPPSGRLGDLEFRLLSVELRAGCPASLMHKDVEAFVRPGFGGERVRFRVLQAAVAEAVLHHRDTGKFFPPHEVINSAHRMLAEVLGPEDAADA